MLHRTPEVFGKDLSQAMMGVQMASAYLGSTFMPPLFGAAAGTFGLFFFPAFLLLLALLLVFCTERTTRRSVNTLFSEKKRRGSRFFFGKFPSVQKVNEILKKDFTVPPSLNTSDL